MKFTVSHSFKTRVETSDRILDIAEAFGIGLDEKEFVLYDNVELDIERGDVVYITGQSGSGKSVLLRDLKAKLAHEGLTVADISDVPMLDTPIINQIGADTDEGVKLLNQAGLGDAYLYCRKPCELSDGQRYRFCLAKLIEGAADVWVADEFAAVLDRQTAKIVAHNISRAARKRSVTLLVATTHTDLREYLGATLTVQKLYGERVELSRYTYAELSETPAEKLP